MPNITLTKNQSRMLLADGDLDASLTEIVNLVSSYSISEIHSTKEDGTTAEIGTSPRRPHPVVA